ncbi:uncharacterized protein LOC131148358 [Malania oleifera]|uniref:uncharacterized protein LOC131148358 n=1 Tax=Malania oleifera TaxID=397392 RepID=UPI0025AE04BB|nr:uncharacterized protein LOC131148358 [Malania oleifera]
MMKEARTNPSFGEASLKSSDSPFTEEVMEVPLPSKFKMPTFERYEGSTDLFDHLDTFKVLMQLQGTLDVIMCCSLAATLKGNSSAWYWPPKPGSSNSFSNMEHQFIRHFIGSRRIAKTLAHLMSLVQEEKETLKKFKHHFVTTALEICNLDHGVVLVSLTTTLQPGDFLYSLGKKPLAHMGELVARAHKYINLEKTGPS